MWCKLINYGVVTGWRGAQSGLDCLICAVPYMGAESGIDCLICAIFARGVGGCRHEHVGFPRVDVDVAEDTYKTVKTRIWP